MSSELDVASLAPIVVFAYNRPFHTANTLRALAKCRFASDSELFVFSDGPRSKNDEANVRAVRELVGEIEGFKSVQIIAQDMNLGLADSVIGGVTKIVNDRGRVIVVEDDLEVSGRFIEYMNSALDHYESDAAVFSIGGYQFPEKTMQIPSTYSYDTYAGVRCCSWGWATWSDRWNTVEWNINQIGSFLDDKKQTKKFDLGGSDLSVSLHDQIQNRIDSWAIRFCFAHFRQSRYCIYPIKTLVRNIGLDGSGVHCGIDPSREHEYLEDEWIPMSFCEGHLLDPEITSRFASCFSGHAIARRFGLQYLPVSIKNTLASIYAASKRIRKR